MGYQSCSKGMYALFLFFAFLFFLGFLDFSRCVLVALVCFPSSLSPANVNNAPLTHSSYSSFSSTAMFIIRPPVLTYALFLSGINPARVVRNLCICYKVAVYHNNLRLRKRRRVHWIVWTVLCCVWFGRW